MKAGLNGVPQVGTLDGWWKEGYDGLGGWAIPTAPEQADADAHDAEQLYRLLEEQVVPLYYTRDSHGVPMGWVEKMRHAIRLAGARFSARRMMQDYVQEYYAPAIHGDALADDPPTV
jgi:starch phosphorylase